jgi:hypothetical protein
MSAYKGTAALWLAGCLIGLACGGDSDGRGGSGDDGIGSLGTGGGGETQDDTADGGGATDPSGGTQGADSMSTGEDGTADDGPDDSGPSCVNLQCQQEDCQGGGTTRLSGVVTIPSGELPLPNVFVYVPNAEVEPIPDVVTCSQCEVSSAVPNVDDQLSGWPLVLTATNERGEFTLDNVPAGADIPLVVQIGKWRRVTTIPHVQACTDNDVDPELTRLPRNQNEGNLPRMAVTNGDCDNLHTLLTKAGVDNGEFTTLNGGNWWNSLDNLLQYDIILMSCECSENMGNKPDAALEAMRDYVNLGGRVFGSHFHYAWMRRNPHEDWASIAQWGNGGGSSPAHVNDGFSKGQMLADWLVEVGGSTNYGEVPISNIRYSVVSVNEGAQRWLSLNNDGTSVQYMSFNAPLDVPPEDRCGRFVFSDMHVTSGGGSISPQEMVLIYMLFDIASCIELEP